MPELRIFVAAKERRKRKKRGPSFAVSAFFLRAAWLEHFGKLGAAATSLPYFRGRGRPRSSFLVACGVQIAGCLL
jgi:hypothetical protein